MTMTTIEPASGASAGVLPRDHSIEAFFTDHRWSRQLQGEPAPAGKLYDAHKADATATGQPVLTLNAFGEAASALPYVRKEKVSGGIVYHGLTLEPARVRARRVVLHGTGPGGGIGYPVWDAALRAELQDHHDRVHDGNAGRCFHPTPLDVHARVNDVVAAALEAAEASGEVDRLVDALLAKVAEPAATPAWVEGLRTMPDPDDAPAVTDQSDQW